MKIKMNTKKILDNFLSKVKKEQSNFNYKNFNNFKPLKQTKISGKKVQVFNNHPIPKRNVIKKAYDKIPDDTNIPLQFMTRKQYLNKYVKNQEKVNNVDFTPKEEKDFIIKRTPHYKNIIGRYTTKTNDYYPPAVVVFNDKDNFKNIKGDKFDDLVFHEYGHELVEKQGMKMPIMKEEQFADNISEYGNTRKIFSDTRAKNYAIKKIQEDNVSKNSIPNRLYRKQIEKKIPFGMGFTLSDKEQKDNIRGLHKYNNKNNKNKKIITKSDIVKVYAKNPQLLKHFEGANNNNKITSVSPMSSSFSDYDEDTAAFYKVSTIGETGNESEANTYRSLKFAEALPLKHNVEHTIKHEHAHHMQNTEGKYPELHEEGEKFFNKVDNLNKKNMPHNYNYYDIPIEADAERRVEEDEFLQRPGRPVVDDDSKNDTSNLYTWQSPKEEESKNPNPASDSVKSRMSIGRSTGWTGTGIYGYTNKLKAVKEAKESPDLYKGRKLYKVKVEKPLVFPLNGYDKFMEASKNHRILTEDSFKNNKPLVGKVLKDYNEAGIKTSEKQLLNTVKQSEKNDVLPSSLLLKERGFDSVIADSDNDTYRTGSVVLGKSGDFKDKLIQTSPEDITKDEYDFYDWNQHSQKSPSYESWKQKRKISDALEKTKKYDKENKDYSEFLKDVENEAFLDKYNDPQQRQQLMREYENVKKEEEMKKKSDEEFLNELRKKQLLSY